MGAIGFFAPLPIALMIPFMGAQSAVMGEAFGKHFQYGKRKISAMSNEEFNKLTSAELFDDTLHGFEKIIPLLKDSMTRTEDLQQFVIQTLVRYVRSLPDDIISGFTSGKVSDSPLIENLESNITGGIDVANAIAGFFQNLSKGIPSAEARTADIHQDVRDAEIIALNKKLKAQEAKVILGSDQDKFKNIPKAKNLGILEHTLSQSKLKGTTKGTLTEGQKSIIKHQPSLAPLALLSPPKHLVTKLKQLKEAVRVGAIAYQKLTSRGGLQPHQLKQFYQSYKAHPTNALASFLKQYSKYRF